MPVSPKRKKVGRRQRSIKVKEYQPGDPFFIFDLTVPKRFLGIRKFLCWIFGCVPKIMNEGYPAYAKHYHVHYQCQRCGNHTVSQDELMPSRPKRYPMSHTVVTFDKQGEEAHVRTDRRTTC